MDIYAASVYRWCRESNLGAEDAADVAQEVFTLVAQHLEDFRGAQPHGSFRAWLRAISRSRIADCLRRKRNEPLNEQGRSLLDRVEWTSPSTPADEEEPLERVDALWRRGLELVQAEFEQQTWQAFWRVAVDGQSPAAVGQELGMSVPAVYQAKSRVLRRLRHQFSELERGD
ncbi:MAG: sigma-70 family RNA polymerase sigma factor [Pirellulales bacterium]|nr:sigma-70 family RNA polymerase sigma factor [Pirellulales bacterium]